MDKRNQQKESNGKIRLFRDSYNSPWPFVGFQFIFFSHIINVNVNWEVNVPAINVPGFHAIIQKGNRNGFHGPWILLLNGVA